MIGRTFEAELSFDRNCQGGKEDLAGVILTDWITTYHPESTADVFTCPMNRAMQLNDLYIGIRNVIFKFSDLEAHDWQSIFEHPIIVERHKADVLRLPPMPNFVQQCSIVRDPIRFAEPSALCLPEHVVKVESDGCNLARSFRIF